MGIEQQDYQQDILSQDESKDNAKNLERGEQNMKQEEIDNQWPWFKDFVVNEHMKERFHSNITADSVIEGVSDEHQQKAKEAVQNPFGYAQQYQEQRNREHQTMA